MTTQVEAVKVRAGDRVSIPIARNHSLAFTVADVFEYDEQVSIYEPAPDGERGEVWLFGNHDLVTVL